MGTADFYAVVEGHEQVLDSLVVDTTELGAPTDGELLCFLVLAPDATLAEVEPQLRQTLRAELSPRHVPDRFVVVEAVPQTLNGKKCEVPVKRILAGVEPEHAVSRDALQNPSSLATFIQMAVADPSPAGAVLWVYAVILRTFAARQWNAAAVWVHPRPRPSPP